MQAKQGVRRVVARSVTVAAVLLTACDGPTPTRIEIPPPLFQLVPNCVMVNGNPESDIFHPCKLDGIVVTARRQPGGPIVWPGGEPCTSIPGGCFSDDPDPEPYIGDEPYYNYGGGPMQPVGSESGWANPVPLRMTTYKGDVHVAISQILYYAPNPACAKLVSELARRESWGFLVATSGYSRTGEWVGREPGGTIYLSRTAGYLWDASGNVIRQGQLDEPLRNTLIEEMIHMWFDTDIGHSDEDSPDAHAAFEAMRQACGHHNF